MSAILNSIIVDDEITSRNVLREYLRKYCPDVTVLGEAESVDTALPLIRQHQPDIVFLDVEMPRGNGFDLLERLGENITFETVFVTAFDHYAIQALNHSAAYYLLKPLSIDDLITAVDKIKKQREKQATSLHTSVILENLQAASAQQKKIVLPLMEGFEVVKIEDIIACTANGNFTDFQIKGKSKMMICRTLKFYENLLSDSGFLRVHKSYLINLEHVEKYRRGKGGEIMMSDESIIPLSPTKREAFLAQFERGR